MGISSRGSLQITTKMTTHTTKINSSIRDEKTLPNALNRSTSEDWPTSSSFNRKSIERTAIKTCRQRAHERESYSSLHVYKLSVQIIQKKEDFAGDISDLMSFKSRYK